MKNRFMSHPNEVGESYLVHMKFAFLFGFNMVVGGLACIIHAIFPFAFEKTGSNMLLRLVHHFIERSDRVEERIVSLAELVIKKQKTEIK